MKETINTHEFSANENGRGNLAGTEIRSHHAMKYTMKLAAVGCKSHQLPVADSMEAVAAFAAYRDSIGTSDMKSGCGDITDRSGDLIARISYNGRVWLPNGQPLDQMSGDEWIALGRNPEGYIPTVGENADQMRSISFAIFTKQQMQIEATR